MGGISLLAENWRSSQGLCCMQAYSRHIQPILTFHNKLLPEFFK